MDMTEFKATDRPFGWLAIPVRDETVAVRHPKAIARELLTQFRAKAHEMGGELVKGSFHQLHNADRQLGIDDVDGHTTYVVYITGK